MVTAVDRKMSLVKSENKIGSDHEIINSWSTKINEEKCAKGS